MIPLFQISWRRLINSTAVFACAAAIATTVPGTAQAESVAGWIETASFPKLGISLPAKLDTGADSSSINATDREEFTKDGKPWIRFTVKGKDGPVAKLERPIHRFALIKRSGSKGDRRPVVRLVVCIAGQTAESDFTLAHRAQLQYPVLIGRKFLAGRIHIDSARKDMVMGQCELKKSN